MGDEYQEARRRAGALLEEGKAQEAFRVFRPHLRYPVDYDETRFCDALRLFARLAGELAGPELADRVRAVVDAPGHLQHLYDLGYDLIEVDLPGVAAMVLARAHGLHPGHEALITELVAALERDGRHEAACRILEAEPDLLEESFVCSYLLAFNGLMNGQLATARNQLPRLRETADPGERTMADRIGDMLARADGIAAVSPLDRRDLRGWHFVLNGSLLLHVAPYGRDEGMNGRYAFTRDTPRRCREAIARLEVVLQAWNRELPCIYVLDGDRSSAILGRATAELLGLPTRSWRDGVTDPGLIVTYDLEQLDGETLVSLQPHHPGQVLWTHASRWTVDHPVGADIVTYLHQINEVPWERNFTLDEETGAQEEVSTGEETPIAVLVEGITQAEWEEADSPDRDELLQVAGAACNVTGTAAPGAFRKTGPRRKQWAGSPVPSNRFL